LDWTCEFDQKEQSFLRHLEAVSACCGRLAGKINMDETSLLIGFLHDFGAGGLVPTLLS
jgi:HD superfamily phosphodiesterase